MADMMIFPKTIQEFIKEYSFKDTEEIYTNGSELIPVFRMEQAHAYYCQEIRNKAIDEFAEQLKNKLVLRYGSATPTEQYVAMQVTEWCNEIAEQMKGE
jgi:hypothetical protein